MLWVSCDTDHTPCSTTLASLLLKSPVRSIRVARFISFAPEDAGEERVYMKPSKVTHLDLDVVAPACNTSPCEAGGSEFKTHLGYRAM